MTLAQKMDSFKSKFESGGRPQHNQELPRAIRVVLLDVLGLDLYPMSK
jgi:hypothetical protein